MHTAHRPGHATCTACARHAHGTHTACTRRAQAGLQLRALDACVSAEPHHAAVAALRRSLRGDPAATAALQTVRARYRECLEALRLLGQSSQGWTFAEAAHGATTHFRHDAAGRLWLRTEGVMHDIGCLECIALWKEVGRERLQPHVLEAATPCAGGCQPYVLEATTPYVRGCDLVCWRMQLYA